MCSACEDEDITPYVPADPELVRRAREVETLMSGERVPEVAWEIYFGFAGGSIEWRHFQRIRLAYDEAERSVPPRRPVLGKRATQTRRLPICAEVTS
jgi:hypothetical protein